MSHVLIGILKVTIHIQETQNKNLKKKSNFINKINNLVGC